MLGLLHGPAELLPISSSAHVTLVPWLLGRPLDDVGPSAHKSFEVALHAGTGAALALAWRREARAAARALDARRIGLLVLACLPAAVAGALLEGPIERRLGTPRGIAAGLAAGGLAMAVADRRPQRREAADAAPVDALALGLAQACALAPGVSRGGATLAAARARGFGRPDAATLSWLAGAPVIAGASLLRARRLPPHGMRQAFAVGAAGAFAGTLIAARALGGPARGRALAPYAAYRLGLAALALRRARADRGAGHGARRRAARLSAG